MKRFSKLAALVLGVALMAFPFASCNTNVSGGGDEPNTPATYIGTKAPSVAKEVGDIVFNDGSVTPYTAELRLTEEQKNAAIAIIFYKGTGLNSNDAEGNPDTTTSRTLGVGLKHSQTTLAWCTNDANAYIKNITTIRCTKDGGTISSDKDGSNNLEQIAAFAGVSDTADAAKYPAFYFAKKYSDTATNLGASYKNGWYLPSIAELDQIYKNKATVDTVSKLCGGNEFGTSGYWSSSQYASIDRGAYGLNFGSGNGNYSEKDSSYSVCAVRAFN